MGTLVIAIVLLPKDHIVGTFHRVKFLQNHDDMNHMQIQNAILNERQFSSIRIQNNEGWNGQNSQTGRVPSTATVFS